MKNHVLFGVVAVVLVWVIPCMADDMVETAPDVFQITSTQVQTLTTADVKNQIISAQIERARLVEAKKGYLQAAGDYDIQIQAIDGRIAGLQSKFGTYIQTYDAKQAVAQAIQQANLDAKLGK